MLADVTAWLRCPVCPAARRSGAGLEPGPGWLRCPYGHSFDVARQGYVNLLVGPAPKGTDTAAMVAARAELFDAGHLDGVRAAVAGAVAPTDRAGLVVEAGAGTGHYLAAFLDRRPGFHGIALDLARPAVRKAARAHERLGAAVCDVWRGLPVADSCADVLLDVFAPRNPAEFHRVLRPDGVLVVAVPRAGHLRELVGPLGLLHVPRDKAERLERALAPYFDPAAVHPYEHPVVLDRDDALRVATMGPAAFHSGQTELAGRAARLPARVEVTLAVDVRTYVPRPGPPRGPGVEHEA